MGLQEFRVAARVRAPVERVWELLDDSRSWPRWTPIDEVEIVVPRPGDGPGEVRIVRNGRYALRERFVERVPLRRLAYTVESGLGVRDYRAAISLTGEEGGTATQVDWHTTFAAKVPGFGGVYRRALEKAARQFVAGLTEAAVAPAVASTAEAGA
jgi:uncharacterized protein YndB with AHSA1/START domain